MLRTFADCVPAHTASEGLTPRQRLRADLFNTMLQESDKKTHATYDFTTLVTAAIAEADRLLAEV